jgi:hypothetical protein
LSSSSSLIEIEPNNNNSIIPYYKDISLYHTNVFKEELDIDTPLLDNFIKFNNNILNTNIPKNIKEIRLNFSKPSYGLPSKIYNNSVVIEDDYNDDNSIIPYNNDISLYHTNLFEKN